MNMFFRGIEFFNSLFKQEKKMPKGIGYKSKKKLPKKSGKTGKGKSYTYRKKKM